MSVLGAALKALSRNQSIRIVNGRNATLSPTHPDRPQICRQTFANLRENSPAQNSKEGQKVVHYSISTFYCTCLYLILPQTLESYHKLFQSRDGGCVCCGLPVRMCFGGSNQVAYFEHLLLYERRKTVPWHSQACAKRFCVVITMVDNIMHNEPSSAAMAAISSPLKSSIVASAIARPNTGALYPTYSVNRYLYATL